MYQHRREGQAADLLGGAGCEGAGVASSQLGVCAVNLGGHPPHPATLHSEGHGTV